MAIQQIQTSSFFKPDMIGDIVEVTAYDKNTGSMVKSAGILRAYSSMGDNVVAEFEGDRDTPALKVDTSRSTLTIVHYEFIFIDTEDAS